jgi:hypothetical protein
MSFSRMTLRNALNAVLNAACLSGAGLTLATSAIAAPNDALLEADPQARYGQGMVALAVDHMNKSLDVFKLRDPSLVLAGENSGDYRGGTLSAGMSPRPGWWVDGALQRRQITYGDDQPQINSWRLGAQWQFLQAQAQQPAAALRLSAWGDQSKQVVKSSPTALACFGNSQNGQPCQIPVTADRLTVNDPKDLNLQADLIGSWALGPVKLSAFVGAGQGKVSVGSITAMIGTTALTYSNGSFGAGFDGLVPKSLNAELQSINYNTRTAQAGFNLAYSTGPWQWRGGYVLQNIQRTGVDDVIRGKNKTPYNVNHTLVGELGYKLSPTLLFFTRGQVMNHQFVTEIPFLYNSLTSQRFNQRYGLLSIGLLASFP